MEEQYPQWRTLAIHESSPGNAFSAKLRRECAKYTPTNFYPGKPLGSYVDGCRCEDLSHQTFPDRSFDIVVTSDVFEHLPEPKEAFQEIARTLKPGGAHIFTVPWKSNAHTVTRAKLVDGEWIHIEKPEYHENPIDPEGCLVTTDWGKEMPFLIQEWAGMPTTVNRIKDRTLGIDGQLNEVFVSVKAD